MSRPSVEVDGYSVAVDGEVVAEFFTNPAAGLDAKWARRSTDDCARGIANYLRIRAELE